MNEEDEEKIIFIIEQGSFYFKVMSFELKNVSATFQRLMDKFFKTKSKEIWKSMLTIS